MTKIKISIPNDLNVLGIDWKVIGHDAHGTCICLIKNDDLQKIIDYGMCIYIYGKGWN